ncbi:hypothetical protein Acr_26g0013830 [Actinidia rufa]|uniref:Prolamin-like domain-containing protein n=1 Tax=Actinidia rufa TaxID=165716 RepID=A0A7J0H5S3_9ERIC|nr:hypothetical protein Acr_26g0013830 [Actinidia rufa]
MVILNMRPSKRVLMLVILVFSAIAKTPTMAHNTNVGILIPEQSNSDCFLTKGCQDQLQNIFMRKRGVLLSDCCMAVAGLSDYCIKVVFSSKYTIAFGNNLKRACIDLGFGPSPPLKYAVQGVRGKARIPVLWGVHV